MATKQHKTGRRSRTKKGGSKDAPSTTRDSERTPPVNASKLGTGLDADTLTLKPFRGDRAGALERRESQTRSAGQSGSLQGLSDSPDAASESVDELIEEGNALEAEVVEGVEDAHDADQGEIKTREVPEDDVPEEYLNNEP